MVLVASNALRLPQSIGEDRSNVGNRATYLADCTATT
jgi:hypothetical protein